MKKLLLFALTAWLLALCVGAAEFADMPDDWSKPALQSAVDNGLLSGSDGLIKPDDNLTRAEMAAVMTRAFGAQKTADLSAFSDVNSDEWYYDSLAKAVGMGIFTGDGEFLHPDDPILREEAFAVLARALSLDYGSLEKLGGFSDAQDISDWAINGTAALVDLSYVNGSDGLIQPQSNITRAEFAQLMYNIFDRYISAPGEYTGDLGKNVVVSCDGVTLKDCSAQNIVVADGVETGVSLQNADISGRILIRSGSANTISGVDNVNISMPNQGTALSHDVYGDIEGGSDFDMAYAIQSVYPMGFIISDNRVVVPQGAIATVDGREISFMIYRYLYMMSLGSLQNPQAQALIKQIKAVYPSQYAQLSAQADTTLENAMLQFAALPLVAQSFGADMDKIKQQAQKTVQETKDYYAGQGLDFEAELTALGLDQAAFDQLSELDAILMSIADMVPDADQDSVQEFITQNGFMRARHILVEDEKTADEILQRLSEGADFMELAEAYNTDPGMTEQGYAFMTGQMVQEFETACSNLEPGQLSGVVQSEYGYHVIQRLELTEQDMTDIKNYLANDIFLQKLEEIEQQLSQKVEYSQYAELIEPASLY